MDEFDGYIKEQNPEIPPEPKKEYKKLPSDKSYPKDIYGDRNNLVNRRFHNFLIVYLILSLVFVIIAISFFLVYVKDGKIGTSISQSINPQFNATVNNEYNNTFQSQNTFYNNITINNYINTNST